MENLWRPIIILLVVGSFFCVKVLSTALDKKPDAGLSVMSDSKGEVKSVVINLPWGSRDLASIPWDTLLVTIGDMAQHMKVYVHSYTDLSPKYFRIYVYSGDNASVESLESAEVLNLETAYFNWLDSKSQVSKSFGITNGWSSQLAKNNRWTWPQFESLYEERRVARGLIETEDSMLTALDELILINDSVLSFKLAQISEVQARTLNALPGEIATNIIFLEPSAFYSGESYRAEKCDNEPFEYKWPIDYVQDRLLTLNSSSGTKLIVPCSGVYADESFLIASKMVGNAGITGTIGVPFCFDGANVMKSDELVIAKDEIMVSCNNCPQLITDCMKITGSAKSVLGDNVRFLEIPESKATVLGTGRKSLPLDHMDMFMNFGLNADGKTWTAFVGQTRTSYYSANYRVLGHGLSEDDINVLRDFNGRLNQIADTLYAWGYDTIRVPLILTHIGNGDGNHTVKGILSFNNAFTEAYQSDQGLVRNAYLPKYSFTDPDDDIPDGLDAARIVADIERAYSGYSNLHWIRVSFRTWRLTSLHCYFKVVERGD